MNMIELFKERMLKEYNANGGRKPDVAILGEHDYDSLMGELQLFFGTMVNIPHPSKQLLEKAPSDFRYEGIHIFKSNWHKTGMMFAALPDEDLS